MDLPYLKTISQIFYQLQKSRYIADIKSLVQVVIWYGYHTNLMIWYLDLIAEYQDKIKLKFSAFLRQHSSCVPLGGIFKKVVINQFQPSQFDVFDVQHNRW